MTNRTRLSCWLFLAHSLPASNRTPGYWCFFLAHSYLHHIVLPVLGGSFWPTLFGIKSYSPVLVVQFGPLLSVTKFLQGIGGSF